MIDINNVQTGLAIMSLVGAIVLLAIAIVAYPTLQEKAKKSKK
jgi:hypothetical protein